MVFTVARIILVLIGIIGSSFIIPIFTALFCHEFQVLPSFIVPMLISWILMAAGLFLLKKSKAALSTRASFVTVALAWISASIFGAIPLYFSGAIPSVTDAFFESCSGFSTTGSSIIENVESLPRSINMWRCQTNWLGGMGIVALTVALLPLLGVGGFQLIKAETTGPEKGKLTPKIATTAKVLWFIYLGLTVSLAILLRISGMDTIDSIAHAFSTLGSGGFSTKNASIGAYPSQAIHIIITVFMFLSAVNFSMYYYLIRGKFQDIRRDSEFKAYVFICIFVTLAITFIEMADYGSFIKSFRYSAFQTISVISTTGYSISDFTTWRPAAQALILMLFFTGGSSGSTAGGIKIIRWIVLGKQLKNEIKKMLHPHGVFSIRINRQTGRKDIVFTVAAFFMAYAILAFITTFLGCLFKLDLFTSFTASISTLGNVGPAFNALGPSHSWAFIPSPLKWWYSFMMIAGRLEFFTVIIFMSPSFWKKH